MAWYHLTDDEADRLNPSFPYLAMKKSGGAFLDISLADEPGWIHVGYIPLPTTWLGWFLYHLAHGIAMRYPLHKVIGYALFESGKE